MTLALALTVELSRWWTDTEPLLRQQTFPRLVLAVVLGICIGTERQWRQRAAGLRTNTLVCLGSAGFVDLGLTIAPSTTQVIAYVVSGVGFLGAGAIMKDGADVRGLNTAATLWCSAAVGACVGAGELLDAIFITVLLLTVNSILRPLSRYIDQRSMSAAGSSTLYRLRVVADIECAAETEQHLMQAIARRALILRDLRKDQSRESSILLLRAVLESQAKSNTALRDVAAELRKISGVESVDLSETDADSD